MKIALHFGTLRGKGSAVVGIGLLDGLISVGESHEFVSWIPRSWPKAEAESSARVSVQRVNLGFVSKFAVENVSMRRALAGMGIDCLLSGGDTSLLSCPVPHVLLVQQAFLACSEEDLDFPRSWRFRLREALMSTYFKAGLKGVDQFVVQTEFMRRRLCERWDLPDDRVEVIPSAIPPKFIGVSCEPDPSATPYVVYVSTPGPHKNHQVLPTIARRLKDCGVEVRFVLTTREHD